MSALAEAIGMLFHTIAEWGAGKGWSTRRTILVLLAAVAVSALLALIAFTDVL
jgi:hypothetical protein